MLDLLVLGSTPVYELPVPKTSDFMPVVPAITQIVTVMLPVGIGVWIVKAVAGQIPKIFNMFTRK